ncbi:DUF1616 domain-containing protein [Haloarchaeobius iranensis]|uniref:Uncharacterized membrane protein n=1 Tax=Haloarchaeobius iranensis TaxID=996166 RepID=A0A1H0ADY9_9EURY|nr:DUF1616 domain-containing protein [Haloarchaeobius iranensis]SDN31695.1 Uncharacterized membrane protein [Haloarchaeobius iranensis]
MGDVPDWWLAIPRPVRTLPADLAATAVLVVLTTLAVFLPVVNETPLRVVLGLPFVLFVPGYAFITALFPEDGSSPATAEDDSTEEYDVDDPETSRSGIDGIERVALSFGLSIALVPLIGLVLNFTPFGIRLVPIVVSLDAFTLVCIAVAAQRRQQLPTEDRFEVPYREWYAAGRDEFLEPDSRGDAVLNVLLVASILLATASVGYAVAVPKEGEQFSEFYVLTENESGDLVADDYPTNYTVGEQRPVVVGIGNHEGEQTEYTVVTSLQRVELVDNRTNISVLEETELERYTTTVPRGENATRNVPIQPTFTGENLRVVFLLYRGSPPANPTVDNAYRELHLWVNVSATNESVSIPSPADTGGQDGRPQVPV